MRAIDTKPGELFKKVEVDCAFDPCIFLRLADGYCKPSDIKETYFRPIKIANTAGWNVGTINSETLVESLGQVGIADIPTLPNVRPFRRL